MIKQYVLLTAFIVAFLFSASGKEEQWNRTWNKIKWLSVSFPKNDY